MSSLQRAWAGLFLLGIGLLMVDVFSGLFLTVNGIPVLGVVGVALMMLVVTSWLNWKFKLAWDERSRRQPRAEGGPSLDS